MAVVDNLQDKNGVQYDIAAKQFSGTRTLTLTGDITGSVTDDFSGSVSISTGIADNAVDTSTIADGAVTTSKVADEAITSAKLSTELQTSIGNIHTHSNKSKLDNYSNAGNSSTPVYIAADGTPTACTAADIKAGKDASGNIITSTYATKTEVDAKNWLRATTIASDANLLEALTSAYAQRTRKLFTCDSPVIANGWPEAVKTNLIVDFIDSASWSVVAIVTGHQSEYYYIATKALSWTKVYYEATSTYSPTGTQAVNGTAVASAIAGKADASDVYTKTEVDNKNYIRSLEINSSTNIDTLSLDSTNKESHYRWFGDKPSGTYTEIPSSEQINCRMIFRNITGSACLQEVYPYESTDHYWVRTKKTSTWSAWKKVYYEATSTYSPTGTQAINGTGVKSAFDNYVASPANNRWIGCQASAFIAGGEQYWPLVKFRVDNNYWDLQFQISRTNRYFDDTQFETDTITLAGFTKSEAGILKVGRLAFGSDGRGYSTNFYHELTTTGSGSSIQYWHTIYIKTEWAANKFQFCRLDKVLGYATISDIQWLAYDTAQTQPTNPIAASYFYPKVSSVAVGSSAVPVYANGSGAIIACTTADIKAGKDGAGNTITSTYATKTEVNSKFGLTASLLTSSDDLNNLYRTSPGVDYYKWTYTDHPDNIPESASGATCLMKLTRKHQANAYCTQEIEVAGTMEYYFIRQSINGGWGDWERVYRNPRKSDDVASFTTDDGRAYTGKAIAEYVAGAIGGNVGGYMGECSKTDVASHTFKMGDWFVASEAGTYTYVVSGTSKTITGVVIGDELYFTTDNELEVKPTTTYEKTANKVTTLDNSTTHYPSTSAVKTYVDNGIANLSNTYETITNVANKNNLKIVEIGIPGSSYATADLNTLGDARNVSWWFWGSANATNISNRPDNNSQFLKIVKFTSSYCEQFCYPRGQSNFYWKRTNNNGVWDSAWVKSYYEATSTYSETGTQAVNGTAVASAIASGTAAKANQVNVSDATAGSWYNVVGASGTGDKSLVDTSKIVYQYSTNDGCTLGLGDTTSSGNSASGKLILASPNANARHLIHSGATSSKILSLGDKAGTILVESDVTSTYNSSGTAPVNGQAIAAALRGGASGAELSIGHTAARAEWVKVGTFDYQTLSNAGHCTIAFSARKWDDSAFIRNIEGTIYLGAYCTKNASDTKYKYTEISFHVDSANIDKETIDFVSVAHFGTDANPTNCYIDVYAKFSAAVQYTTARFRPVTGAWSFRLNRSTIVYETTAPTGDSVIDAYWKVATHRTGETAVGGADTPVYVAANGEVVAISTANLKAGKDGAGNTITSTYATKTELTNGLATKQNSLPTTGSASSTYAINVSGQATKAEKDASGNTITTYYAKQADMGATYVAATRTLRFDGLTFN